MRICLSLYLRKAHIAQCAHGFLQVHWAKKPELAKNVVVKPLSSTQI